MIDQLLVVLVGAGLSLGVAWLVGNTLAARLEREKKLTERDVAAQTTFQATYGDFFSVWKQWGNSGRDEVAVARLLPLAAQVEGNFEALLVMVCGDRVLSEDDQRALGSLRQGFQQLRNAIATQKNVEWWSSEDRSYRAMKVLTAQVVVILRPRTMRWGGRGPVRPDRIEAAEALLEVTSNKYEGQWVNAAEALVPTRSHGSGHAGRPS